MTAIECIPLYSFEEAVESAVKSVLVDNEIEAFTTFDAPQLEMPRPRVEVEFQTGAASGHRNPNTEVYRTDAFAGNCILRIVTNTNDGESEGTTPSNAGARAHAQYRAIVRYICATIESTLTDEAATTDLLLPYHTINRFVEMSTAPTVEHESGVLVSTLTYETHFNIRPAAWPA